MKDLTKQFLLALAASLLTAVAARAGTVILSTTAYNGSNTAGVATVALPEVGYYMFDMVVTATATAMTSSHLPATVHQRSNWKLPGEITGYGFGRICPLRPLSWCL